MTPHAATTRRFARHPRGLTLLELLLALAITVMTGAAMSTMVISVARGLTGISESRSGAQRAHLVHTRLRAYTETALCVLQTDPTLGFALWLYDGNGDGGVNASEYRVFWFHETYQLFTMEYVEWPESWTEAQKTAADVTLTSADDHFAMMETLRALSCTTLAVLGDEIAGLELEFDGADVRQAARFRLRATVGGGGQSQSELLFALALPQHTVPQ